MMTKSENIVYTYLQNECYFTKYKLIEINEISIHLDANNEKVKKSDIKQIMSLFEKENLISIKYSDDTVYCIKLIRQESPQPQQKVPHEVKSKNKSIVLLILLPIGFLLCLCANLLALWIFEMLSH